METAGRAVIFSGIAVALGLALLVAMPVPFIRMLGVAGFLIPIVSILGAAPSSPSSSPTTAARGIARRRIVRGPPRRPERRVLGAPRPLDHGLARMLYLARRRRPAGRRRGAGVLHAGDAGLELRHPARARSRCAASTC